MDIARKNRSFKPDDCVTLMHELFQVAVKAADPRVCLPPYLPEPPEGKVTVIGAGKASAAMAAAVEQAWPTADIQGCVVTRYDYALPTQKIEIIQAAHPVPDEAGEQACQKIIQLAENAGENDLVLALISGGGSALLSAPAPCLSSQEKRSINKALLKSGATIDEMNTVRKHLSLVKGGRLGLACYPAGLVTLVVSDVPGDDPAVVASGPTLPDPTTGQEALRIVETYGIEISEAIHDWLSDPANETPKPGSDRFKGHQTHIIAKAQDSLTAAANFAQEKGITPVFWGDDLEGEARELGKHHIRKALQESKRDDRPLVFLSGGETTVTVKGQGRGGRNAEYLLGAFEECMRSGTNNMYVMACDTDGIDGSEDNAGAYFTPQTLEKAQVPRINPQDYLANNDAYSFFERTGTLIKTGPTFTNVNDFRAILIT